MQCSKPGSLGPKPYWSFAVLASHRRQKQITPLNPLSLSRSLSRSLAPSLALSLPLSLSLSLSLCLSLSYIYIYYVYIYIFIYFMYVMFDLEARSCTSGLPPKSWCEGLLLSCAFKGHTWRRRQEASLFSTLSHERSPKP